MAHRRCFDRLGLAHLGECVADARGRANVASNRLASVKARADEVLRASRSGERIMDKGFYRGLQATNDRLGAEGAAESRKSAADYHLGRAEAKLQADLGYLHSAQFDKVLAANRTRAEQDEAEDQLVDVKDCIKDAQLEVDEREAHSRDAAGKVLDASVVRPRQVGLMDSDDYVPVLEMCAAKASSSAAEFDVALAELRYAYCDAVITDTAAAEDREDAVEADNHIQGAMRDANDAAAAESQLSRSGEATEDQWDDAKAACEEAAAELDGCIEAADDEWGHHKKTEASAEAAAKRLLAAVERAKDIGASYQETAEPATT